MSGAGLEFRRAYLVRLPLPLAQLYCRAYNAKDARGRHDNAFYLFEAIIKLAAAPAVAYYLREVAGGTRPRVPALDRQLAQLALPSLGQWVGILRETSRYFGERVDASTHPLGHLWPQLSQRRKDLPDVLALYGAIKNGADGAPGTDESCSLIALFDALVQYRNGVFGHGAARFDMFYEQQMGPLLFPAINELLAEGVFDLLGPAASRLVYLTEKRTLDDGRIQIAFRELVGMQGERTAPLELSEQQAAGLLPGRMAVLWPGYAVPLRLDPLLQYRESELAEEVLFLNRDRNGRQVEYLSYTTGRTERDKSMLPALAALLSRVANRPIDEADLERLAEQSLSETPPVEAIMGEAPPAHQVGDYELLAELGRGGMGVVYLARQLSLGRLVALKMLPSSLAADAVAMGRFQREIRCLARCDHPHIVKVLGSGTLPDGRMFYAMEYVPGSDLEQVWRELSGLHRGAEAGSLSRSTWSEAVLAASRKQRDRTEVSHSSTRVEGEAAPLPRLPLPPLPQLPSAVDNPGGYVRRVVMLVRDTALALQAVHDQGMVHRDIKPANLVLTPDGKRVVLMDFGLAKGDSTSSLTRDASFLGTLRYAAPEQLTAGMVPVGPQADVRALGVTMWELLTRERLFAEADDRQLPQLVLDQDVPRLRSVDASLDADLEAIVARATERRASDRIQSADQMAAYLQMFLAGQALPIRPPGTGELMRRWAREHRALVRSVAAAVACVVVVSVVAFVNIVRERARAEENFRMARSTVDQYFTTISEDRLLNEPGFQGLRQQLLKGALDYYQSFVGQRGDDPELHEELAAANFRIGKLTSEIGSKPAALANFEEALRAQNELVRQNPGEPRLQFALSNTWNEIGRIKLATGKVDDAYQALERSRDLRQELVDRFPQDAEYGRKLASSFMNLSAVHGTRNELPAALQWLERALGIQQQLLQASPNDINLRRDVAKGHYNQAVLEHRRGRMDVALGRCRQALADLRALYEELPNDLQFQGLLSQAARLTGELAELSGDKQASLEAFEEARGLIATMVQRNPLVSEYRVQLAFVLRNIGQLRAEPSQALEAFQQSKDALVRLANDSPKVVRYRHDLANIWLEIGRSQKRLQQTAGALASFQTALSIGQALILLAPDNADYLDSAAQAFGGLAAIEQTMPDQLSAARTNLREALKIHQQLAGRNPDNPKYQLSLARTYAKLGQVTDQLKNPAEAIAYYALALDHARHAVELAPTVASYRAELIKRCSEIAESHRLFGRPEAALSVALEHKRLAAGNAAELHNAASSLALTAELFQARHEPSSSTDRASEQQAVEAAVDALHEAIVLGAVKPERLGTDPQWEALHQHPRFAELWKNR